MLRSFEDVLNSLLHFENADIYVTGSNSRFLSKDVITEFSRRGDAIHLFPLSFSEFMQAYDGDLYHGWGDYTKYRGFPLIATTAIDGQKASYLTHLFSEVYMKNIIDRNGIEKPQESDDFLNALSSSVGSLTDVSWIHATFESVLHSQISQNTIRQYDLIVLL